MSQTIKLLHAGDLHLGFRQYGLAAREGDFYSVAAQIFKRGVEESVDAILLAGDVFDATKPPSTAVKILKQLVECVKGYGIRVLAVDGKRLLEGNWMENLRDRANRRKVVTLKSVQPDPDANSGIDSCRPGTL
jgi:metallophosphoesterase superfamily enzyme